MIPFITKKDFTPGDVGRYYQREHFPLARSLNTVLSRGETLLSYIDKLNKNPFDVIEYDPDDNVIRLGSTPYNASEDPKWRAEYLMMVDIDIPADAAFIDSEGTKYRTFISSDIRDFDGNIKKGYIYRIRLIHKRFGTAAIFEEVSVGNITGMATNIDKIFYMDSSETHVIGTKTFGSDDPFFMGGRKDAFYLSDIYSTGKSIFYIHYATGDGKEHNCYVESNGNDFTFISTSKLLAYDHEDGIAFYPEDGITWAVVTEFHGSYQYQLDIILLGEDRNTLTPINPIIPDDYIRYNGVSTSGLTGKIGTGANPMAARGYGSLDGENREYYYSTFTRDERMEVSHSMSVKMDTHHLIITSPVGAKTYHFDELEQLVGNGESKTLLDLYNLYIPLNEYYTWLKGMYDNGMPYNYHTIRSYDVYTDPELGTTNQDENMVLNKKIADSLYAPISTPLPSDDEVNEFFKRFPATAITADISDLPSGFYRIASSPILKDKGEFLLLRIIDEDGYEFNYMFTIEPDNYAMYVMFEDDRYPILVSNLEFTESQTIGGSKFTPEKIYTRVFNTDTEEDTYLLDGKMKREVTYMNGTMDTSESNNFIVSTDKAGYLLGTVPHEVCTSLDTPQQTNPIIGSYLTNDIFAYITTDGSLYIAGKTYQTLYGTDNQSIQQVTGSNVIAVTGGGYNMFFIAEGKLYYIGDNSNGDLAYVPGEVYGIDAPYEIVLDTDTFINVKYVGGVLYAISNTGDGYSVTETISTDTGLQRIPTNEDGTEFTVDDDLADIHIYGSAVVIKANNNYTYHYGDISEGAYNTNVANETLTYLMLVGRFIDTAVLQDNSVAAYDFNFLYYNGNDANFSRMTELQVSDSLVIRWNENTGQFVSILSKSLYGTYHYGMDNVGHFGRLKPADIPSIVTKTDCVSIPTQFAQSGRNIMYVMDDELIISAEEQYIGALAHIL